MAGKLGMRSMVLALVLAAAPAGALTVPFSEEFATNASGWVNATSAALTWNATGGPDGGSYVSTTLGSLGAPQGTIQFRANDSFNASGDAFVGNWIGNVSVLTAQVIHDATVPLTFFFRFAPSAGGAMVGIAPPVSPNTWTTISIPIDAGSLTSAGGSFATTMANVANLQVGVIAPSGFESVPFTYGLDKVTIVPEPASAGLLAIGLVAFGCARRRQS
jgi:hypothetical protein